MRYPNRMVIIYNENVAIRRLSISDAIYLA